MTKELTMYLLGALIGGSIFLYGIRENKEWVFLPGFFLLGVSSFVVYGYL